MQECKLPDFNQQEPEQIPLGEGSRYKPTSLRGTRAPGNLNAKHIRKLVHGLTGEWLLGCPPERLLTQYDTVLSKWHTDVRTKFSEDHIAEMSNGAALALQYMLNLFLCNHVKVKMVKLGPEQAIKDLCVRGRASTDKCSACCTWH